MGTLQLDSTLQSVDVELVTTQTSSQIPSQMQNALLERAFTQRKSLILLVAREGFEPPTFGL